MATKPTSKKWSQRSLSPQRPLSPELEAKERFRQFVITAQARASDGCYDLINTDRYLKALSESGQSR